MPSPPQERTPPPPAVTDERMGERRSLARGGALSFIGSAASALLGFLVVLAAARLLGDAGAGVLFQAIGIFSIVTVVAKMGLDSAALWRLPQLVETNPHLIRSQVNFVFALSAMASVAAAGATLLGGRVLAQQPTPSAVAESMSAIAWLIPFGTGVLVAMGVTRALGDLVTYVTLGNIALPLLRLAAVVAAAGAGLTAAMVSTAWAVATLPVCVALIVTSYRAVGARERETAVVVPRWPARADRRSVVRFALPRTVSAALEQALVWLNVILVGALLGTASAGIYGAATRFIAAGLIVDTALRIVISPRFSLLLHRGDLGGASDLFRTATGWLVLLASPGLVLLAVFAPVCLAWLGPEFVDGATVLVVLCLGSLVTLLAGNVHTLLLMSGHSGWAAANKVVALGVSTAGTLLLAPRIGLVGAALAWSAAQLLDAVLAAVEVRLILGIGTPARAALTSLATSGISIGVPALAARILLGPTPVALVVGSAGAITIWLAVVYLSRERLALTGLRDASP